MCHVVDTSALPPDHRIEHWQRMMLQFFCAEVRVFPHAGHDFQQKMLGVRAYRQQLMASNIANADTPGYKAVDIDIEEAAQIVQGASTPLSLTTTASGHLSGGAPTPPFPLKYHVPYQASADGNTVEMDVERQKFSENSLMYQFSLDRVSGHFKMLMELYQNFK